MPASGHVFRVERKAGPVWFAKFRLPDGRQVQKRIGPAWTQRARPADGSFTKRTAEAWLAEVLTEADARRLTMQRRSSVTFAAAAAEWLRYCEHERACKPTTLRDYRHSLSVHLLPEFGDLALEDIAAEEIERWRRNLDRSPRTKNKLPTVLNGVFRRAKRAYGCQHNPVTEIDRLREGSRIDLDVFSPEEVLALVRPAASAQDATIVLTAAFTGLRRGELVALRWRDVDFANSLIRVRSSYAGGMLTTPKSGRLRSVPLSTQVAARLAQLAKRGWSTGEDDLVFVGELGGYVDGSALRRRYVDALATAGPRPLRFHDLRHTFGTRMIAKADILRVKEWMGHADVQTTMRYPITFRTPATRCWSTRPSRSSSPWSSARTSRGPDAGRRHRGRKRLRRRRGYSGVADVGQPRLDVAAVFGFGR